MAVDKRLPVLIIGGGIAGLVLAQGLRKLNIPFLLFERDTATNSRLQGWALTVHFALKQLLELLPQDILDRLDDTLVDPTLSSDRSNSVFINLETCEYKWKLPPGFGDRKRLARDRFRQLLLQGLKEHMHWGKQFVRFVVEDGFPAAVFHDGSTYKGQLLVGADGSSSIVRTQLYDLELAPLDPLPVTFLGTSLFVKEPQVEELRKIDPTLFQGCHPKTRSWMWFSIMESPSVTGTADLAREDRVWKVQLCVSWLETPEAEVGGTEDLSTDEARVLAMREKAAAFDPRIQDVFNNGLQADHKPVMRLKLRDWSIPEARLFDPQGAVVLAGDSAHSMSMYRGEGFNHSLLDVYGLVQAIKTVNVTATNSDEFPTVRQDAMEAYEREVKVRGRTAVAMCRQACIEVHYWDKLSSESTVRQRNPHLP